MAADLLWGALFSLIVLLIVRILATQVLTLGVQICIPILGALCKGAQGWYAGSRSTMGIMDMCLWANNYFHVLAKRVQGGKAFLLFSLYHCLWCCIAF